MNPAGIPYVGFHISPKLIKSRSRLKKFHFITMALGLPSNPTYTHIAIPTIHPSTNSLLSDNHSVTETILNPQ